MFPELVNDAKSAAGAVIAKYAVRASVAAPFFIAIAFATAALTIVLVERLGAIAAYLMVAAGFAVVGVIGVFAVKSAEHEGNVVEQTAVQELQAATPSVAASESTHMSLAFLGSLIAAAGGPSSTMGIARLVGRNLPLVAVGVLVGVLLLPGATPPKDSSDEDDLGPVKGSDVRPLQVDPASPPF